MNLHDEVLKEIEKGPQGPEGSMRQESHRAFATRIAELATRLEREACVKVCNRFSDSLENGSQDADACAKAIETRGKE